MPKDETAAVPTRKQRLAKPAGYGIEIAYTPDWRFVPPHD
jgi:hypothetical protein